MKKHTKKLIIHHKRLTGSKEYGRDAMNREDVGTGKHIKGMSGGKFLGEGTFGCVVSPPLECGKRSYSSKYARRYSIARKDVSKIIKTYGGNEDETVQNEIKISDKLKLIDPNERFFIHIKEHCKIQNVPKERSDLASVRFIDDEFSEVYMLERKKLDKHYCDIDLRYKPSNLILSNGGVEMGDALHTFYKNYSSCGSSWRVALERIANNKKRDERDEYIRLGLSFFKDFKQHLQHLLEGIYKLQQNNITNRDIKIENMMIDWTDSRKNATIIRYIDFGFSEVLTNEYRSSKNNIHAIGTAEFIPPEIVIASNIKRNYGFNTDYIFNKVNRDMDDGVKKIHRELHLDYSKLRDLTKSLIETMKNGITNGTLLELYFGKRTDKFNGYVQKSDVYALGMTIYELVHKYGGKDPTAAILRKNIKLDNLLKNMIELDPEKRYNILECLKHPYFSR